MNNFHPLEFVGRTNEAQLQVGENLKYLLYCFKGLMKGYLTSLYYEYLNIYEYMHRICHITILS